MRRSLLRLALSIFILSSLLLVTPPVVPGEASVKGTTGSPEVQSEGVAQERGTEVPDAAARKHWKERIDNIVGGRPVGVSVRLGNQYLYNLDAKQKRAPASNEKLLMSMALFDSLDPTSTLQTKAAAAKVHNRKIVGDLWLIGRGDPSLTGGGSYGRTLPFPPTRISSLARKVKKLGIERITGSVRGAISYFSHDWYAPGWKSDFPAEEVPLPAALSFEGNRAGERHISDPELRAARSLTRRLRAIGVRVAGEPAAAGPPQDLTTVATVRSVPVARIVRFANVTSSNYFAE
ncbi:MAG: D-alanyl-D-alanine carboxypeptidase, partial [Actinomycetota bacterium]